MDTFLDGKEVWVLGNTEYEDQGPASILTSIDDLADIWGPIWKLKKGHDSSDLGGSEMCYYAIGAGAIGALPIVEASDPMTIPDVLSCHFVPSLSKMEDGLRAINPDCSKMLLIGALTPKTEFLHAACPYSQSEVLDSLNLRPHGTSKTIRYKDSTTYNIVAGYSGVQVGMAKQYKLRHGVTRKQRLQTKWMLQSGRCNLKNLNLWLGLEVSLCTRNARRRKLFHILGSHTILQYIRHGGFEWCSPECEKKFYESVAHGDFEQFLNLFQGCADWRRDVEHAVSWLLEALLETGIESKGNLAAFTFVQDSDDPEQLAILPEKHHSWSGFLKDTVYVATFAITSENCLSFPHKGLPGQKCRTFELLKPQFSVLETAVIPKEPYDPQSSRGWNRSIPVGKHLSLESSRLEMLRLLAHLPNDHIIVRWSATEFARAVVFSLPGRSEIVRFRERMEDSDYVERTGAVTYVISKYENNLHSLQPPQNQECSPLLDSRSEIAEPEAGLCLYVPASGAAPTMLMLCSTANHNGLSSHLRKGKEPERKQDLYSSSAGHSGPRYQRCGTLEEHMKTPSESWAEFRPGKKKQS
ncbi:hypothetical protein MMC12_005308 [Toensbergia leucococca]|nr:hypothetical protein [Toensbergia leucococca]